MKLKVVDGRLLVWLLRSNKGTVGGHQGGRHRLQS